MEIRTILTLVLALVPALASADEACPYCGNWEPYYRSPEQPRVAAERLTIAASTLSLPGCSAVTIGEVFRAPEETTSKTDDGRAQRVKVVFKTSAPLVCEIPLLDTAEGALVEVELRLRGPTYSPRLQMAMFPDSVFEDLKASYTHEVILTPPGSKQQVRRPPRPREIIKWSLVREGYNACDEGSAAGAQLCSLARYYRADGELNAEWRRLMNTINAGHRSDAPSRQSQWRQAMQTACKKRTARDWRGDNWQWVLAAERMCQADALAKRSGQLRALLTCIESGKASCPRLSVHP